MYWGANRSGHWWRFVRREQVPFQAASFRLPAAKASPTHSEHLQRQVTSGVILQDSIMKVISKKGRELTVGQAHERNKDLCTLLVRNNCDCGTGLSKHHIWVNDPLHPLPPQSLLLPTLPPPRFIPLRPPSSLSAFTADLRMVVTRWDTP